MTLYLKRILFRLRHTTFDLVHHDSQSGGRHVESRVLLRVRRCDDLHVVERVTWINLKNKNKSLLYLQIVKYPTQSLSL